jgi:aspartate/methionine/tyrosine aminotransferase
MDSPGERAGAALKAAARSEIASFMVMDVMAAAARLEAQGRRIVHLEVGQPGTGAPRSAREAAKRAIDDEALGYTLALGMPALRERLAQHYKDTYDVDVGPERIVITNGSSAGFVLAFLALFNAGDAVAVPSPGYPCYRNILTALGQPYVAIETDAAGRWMPTVSQIEAAGDIRGLLIASPNNPTGTMIEPVRLAALVDWCVRSGRWFISDEIYHGLSFGRPATTALATSQDAIVINSFSKYFSMTGWRVGWLVVPQDLVAAFERLAQNLFICAPAVSQAAALGAFDGREELEENVARYARNRAFLMGNLPNVGFSELVPADGGFYLYADVSRFTNDSLAFSRVMLDEAGVAATSGVDFDETRGTRYLRFSYAGTYEDMQEAVERLSRWERLKG